MNQDRFKEVMSNYKQLNTQLGIGSLQEKSLHLIVKNYLCSDEEKQEVKVGNYYCDIVDGDLVIEIQTRHFNKLVPKLSYLLEEKSVQVVYPNFAKKNIIYLDNVTKEVIENRISPKRGSIYDVFFELYRIKQFLHHPNLKVKILLFNIDEYRLLGKNNSKLRTRRFNQIPTELIGEVNIDNVLDYYKFIPCELPDEFTSKDYQKATKLSLRKAQVSLNILKHLNIIKLIGKSGRLNLYSINGDFED